MTKNLIEDQRLTSLIDGLEDLMLTSEQTGAMSAGEEAQLAQSMQLILAASAARANLESAPKSEVRRASLKRLPAVKFRELRALLATPQIARTQMSATFETEDSTETNLGVLINDIERIISSRQKI